MREKKDYRFPKTMRLHHRSLAEGLFRMGKSFYEFPFRLTWRILTPGQLEKNFRSKVPEGIGKMQLMITVPKKKRRHAVDRALLRRRLREAYRLNRHQLCEMIENQPEIATLSLSIVYIHDQNLPYSEIQQKLQLALAKLMRKIAELPQL